MKSENKRYKVITDNLGEYLILRHDNSLVVPEIPHKAMAELFCDELNELNDENKNLKQIQQDYEDNVSNWFIENWQSLTDEQRQTAHLELGIELEDLE